MGGQISNFYVSSTNQLMTDLVDGDQFKLKYMKKYFIDFCTDKALDYTNKYTHTQTGAGTIVQNSTESTGTLGAYKYATGVNLNDKEVLSWGFHVGRSNTCTIRSSHAFTNTSSWWLGWGIDVSIPAQWSGCYFYFDGTDLKAYVGNGVSTTASAKITNPSGSTMHHYSIVRNTSTYDFYIDNVLVASLVNTNEYGATTSILVQAGILNLSGGSARNLKVGGVWIGYGS